MSRAYQFEDEIFRLSLFMKLLDQGVDPSTAGQMARDQFINYDIRAPWVNAARRTVLPFLSYSYRALPLIADSVVNKPWKLAKYISLGALLMLGDDEEERASMPAQDQGMTWAAIPGTSIGLPRRIRTPFENRYGDSVYLDIGRWMPGADVFDANTGGLADVGIPSWLTVGGPLATGFEIAFNKANFFQEDIWDPQADTKGEIVANIAQHAWGFLRPRLGRMGRRAVRPRHRRRARPAWAPVRSLLRRRLRRRREAQAA